MVGGVITFFLVVKLNSLTPQLQLAYCVVSHRLFVPASLKSEDSPVSWVGYHRSRGDSSRGIPILVGGILTNFCQYYLLELRKSFSIRVLSLFFSIFHPTHLWDLKYLVNKSFVLGGGGGTRTQDLWVLSRTHYPLHYGDAAFIINIY